MAFSDEDLESLLKEIKPKWSDIYCPTVSVMKQSPSLDIQFDLNSRDFSEVESAFHVIDQVHQSPQKGRALLSSISRPGDSEFGDALELFIQDPDPHAKHNKLFKMDDILVKLTKSKDFCPIRMAYWRLKLVWIIFKASLGMKNGIAVPLCYSIFQKVVLTSKVSDLCPAILDNILEVLSKKRRHFKLEEKLIPKLRKIYTLYPSFPSIGGEDLSQRVRRWVDSAQDDRSEDSPPIPDDDLSIKEAFNWWGTYPDLLDAIFMPQNLHTSLSIEVKGHQGHFQRYFHTLPELLETLTSNLSLRRGGIFKKSPDGLVFRDDINDPFQKKCNALIRTIMCNMIYRGELGFKLAQSAQDTLFNYSHEASNPFIERIRKWLLGMGFPFP